MSTFTIIRDRYTTRARCDDCGAHVKDTWQEKAMHACPPDTGNTTSNGDPT